MALFHQSSGICGSIIFFHQKSSCKQKKFAVEREIIQGLIRLLLPFKELLIKLQTVLMPSLYFGLIGIGGLWSTLSSFDALLKYEKTNKAYHQKENLLSSLNLDDSNSTHEDEGNTINTFFSFNLITNDLKKRMLLFE